MSIEQIFYALAIVVMLCLLAMVVFIVVILFNLYRSFKHLERTVVEKINTAEEHLKVLQHKKSFMMGAVPAVGMLTSFLFQQWKKRK